MYMGRKIGFPGCDVYVTDLFHLPKWGKKIDQTTILVSSFRFIFVHTEA